MKKIIPITIIVLLVMAGCRHSKTKEILCEEMVADSIYDENNVQRSRGRF